MKIASRPDNSVEWNPKDSAELEGTCQVNLHVSKIFQRFVQHDDVWIFLLETGRFVFPLVVTPFAKVLLHHIRLLALPLLLALRVICDFQFDIRRICVNESYEGVGWKILLFIALCKFSEHVGENLLLLFVVVLDFLLANCNLVKGSLILRLDFTNYVEVLQSFFEIA